MRIAVGTGQPERDRHLGRHHGGRGVGEVHAPAPPLDERAVGGAVRRRGHVHERGAARPRAPRATAPASSSIASTAARARRHSRVVRRHRSPVTGGRETRPRTDRAPSRGSPRRRRRESPRCPGPSRGRSPRPADRRRADHAGGRLEDEGGVAAAEAERGAEADARARRGRALARHVVEVALGIGLLEVQRGRDQAPLRRHSRHIKASSAAAAPMVWPRLRLDRVDGHLVRPRAQGALERPPSRSGR